MALENEELKRRLEEKQHQLQQEKLQGQLLGGKQTGLRGGSREGSQLRKGSSKEATVGFFGFRRG